MTANPSSVETTSRGGHEGASEVPSVAANEITCSWSSGLIACSGRIKEVAFKEIRSLRGTVTVRLSFSVRLRIVVKVNTSFQFVLPTLDKILSTERIP
jgi:hypothetical protein